MNAHVPSKEINREQALKILAGWLEEETDAEQAEVLRGLQRYLYAPYYCHQCHCARCGNTFAVEPVEVRCTECGARARHWETRSWDDVKKDSFQATELKP